jgi:ABC-type sugar transport system ATPase subunit
VVGVRPHDLSLEPLCQKGGSALAGCVSLLEPFGARTDVHVTLAGGEKCIVSAPPHIRLKIGDEVRVYIDPDKLHLFQPDGTALDRTPGKPCGEHGGEVG